MSDAHFSNQRTDFAAADERLADAFDEVVDLLLTSPELEDQQILDRFPDRADALRELLPTLRTIASRPPTPGEPTPREPTPGEVAEVVEQGEPPTELKQLGEFLVHRKIGHGGMGVVYLAEQPSLNRRVALKVLGTASTLDARQLNRFKIEAQVAGSLHHPHIVPIYAVGDDRGVCYYAMQYIDGPSLAELLAALRADHAALDGGDSTGRSPADSRTPTEALQEEVSTARSNRPLEYFCRVAEWMAQAADGLAYAHENSVLHRDVKPGNLLLDRSGKLWITDFGLARLQSSSTMTATGDVIGTLRYMSPEQARVKPLLVDQRTDVYALGMTLYELLTLQPAFASDDRQELIRQIACNDPRPLRSIDPAIPVDLETVVLKAIEKEPRDRYLTAGELRDDLNRFLENRPVAAKRPALLDRAGKLVRRNRVASTAIAAALLIVAIASTLAAAVSLDAYREARVEQAKSDAATEAAQDSEQRALDALAAEQQALDMANTALYQSRMLLAKQAFADGYGSRVQSLLDACAPKEGETDRRSWEWRLLREGLRRTSQLVAPEAVGGSWLDWSRDGAMYLTSGGEQLRVWDASTHEEIRHWSIFLRLFREASFSPDGRRIAVGCADGSVRLLSLESDQQEILKTKAVQKLRAGDHPVDWSPDGKWIATGCGQQVTVIDVEKRATLAEAEYAGGLWCLAWSPDGEHVAFGGHGPAELDVLHVSSNATRTLCEPHGHDLWSLEWTRDGSRIVTGSFDRTVKLIDFASGETLATLQHPAGVAAARLSPDGKLIASATTGQQVMLWELETGKLLRSLPGALSRSSDLAWSPDQTRLLTSDGADVRLWNVSSPTRQLAAGHRRAVNVKRRLAAIEHGDGFVRVYHLPSSEEQYVVEGELPQWSVDGNRLAVQHEQELSVIDAATGKPVVAWQLPEEYHIAPGLYQRNTAWSACGNYLLTHGPNSLAIWDATTGVEHWEIEGYVGESHAWAPHGALLATVADGIVSVWDAANTVHVSDVAEPSLRSPFFRVYWDPEARRIATGGWDGFVEEWNAAAGQFIREYAGHAPDHYLNTVAWDPTGRYMASGGWDHSVIVWDTQTGELHEKFLGHNATILELAFHPTQSRLACADTSGRVKIWDLNSASETMALSWGESTLLGDHLIIAGDDEHGERSTLQQRHGEWLEWADDGRTLWVNNSGGLTIFEAGADD